VVVLEFIIWTPVFVILIFALVEFALILTGLQQVKAASYAGAKVASELTTANLASGVPGNNITLVDNAVAKVLSSSGMTRCETILEYNPSNTCVAGSPGTKTAGGCGSCYAPATPLPSNANIPGGTVRVTVCVDINQLTPNMLSNFGFNVSGRTAKVTTLLPYENCSQ